MSTAHKCRYLLAAGAAFVGIGMLMEGVILTGVFFLMTAVLLLPVLYQLLYIDSNEVQLLSPIVFLVVAIFSFAMYNVVPKPYTIPPKIVYSDTVAQTSTFAAHTTAAPATTMIFTTTQTPVVSTQATTVITAVPTTAQTASHTVSAVYRTPSGKRYHLDPDCGGENSYEVSFEDAESAGLTPCKKCAGG